MATRNGFLKRSFSMQNDDWFCTNNSCKNLNFARRTKCNICGKSKPFNNLRRSELNNLDPKRSRKFKRIFNPDDWQCGRCGNVNWARRESCNMCNEQKKTENESRLGLGGGYNERENIEYIKRNDSDEEYDDFGRKRKKSNLNDKSVFKRKYKEEKEEESDENEDDIDISKYDLSDFTTVDETKETNEIKSDSKTKISRSKIIEVCSTKRSSSNSRKNEHNSKSRERKRSTSKERKRSTSKERKRSTSKERKRSTSKERKNSSLKNKRRSRSRDRKKYDSNISKTLDYRSKRSRSNSKERKSSSSRSDSKRLNDKNSKSTLNYKK